MKLTLAATSAAAGVVASRLVSHSRLRDLNDDVVLITGGSRGLGLALARKFAKQRCRLAICARDKDELDRASRSLAAAGAEVLALPCDVTNRSEVDQLISDVTTHYGRVDILVTNAGVIQVGPVESVVIEDFEQAMNVMFWGTVFPTMALLPGMLERNSGHIVNITSIGGKVGVPHLLPYTCAKYAATGFSEGLRAELVRSGVRITTIAPGLMRTGSYNAALFKGDHEAEAAWFSISSSLPGITINAERAAGQIVNAVRRGQAEKVLTTSASLMARLYGLAPSLMSSAIGTIGAMVLPNGELHASSDQKRSKPGWGLPNLRSPKMKAALFLGRMAAQRLNQKYA